MNADGEITEAELHLRAPVSMVEILSGVYAALQDITGLRMLDFYYTNESN